MIFPRFFFTMNAHVVFQRYENLLQKRLHLNLKCLFCCQNLYINYVSNHLIVISVWNKYCTWIPFLYNCVLIDDFSNKIRRKSLLPRSANSLIRGFIEVFKFFSEWWMIFYVWNKILVFILLFANTHQVTFVSFSDTIFYFQHFTVWSNSLTNRDF